MSDSCFFSLWEGKLDVNRRSIDFFVYLAYILGGGVTMQKEIFGAFIAHTRRELGLTQKALADKLHVTDKAVSKWERGLCYPDLTLMEELACVLGLTMTELMSCQKSEIADSSVDNHELAVRSLLDISGEAIQVQRTSIWKRVIIAAATMLVLVIAAACLILNAPKTAKARVTMKQAIGTDYFIYIEENGHLIRLQCPDQDMYNAITVDNETEYSIRGRWNESTYRGSVITCEKEERYTIGSPLDEVGSAIGVDQMFDRLCVFQEYMNITADRYREKGYLYTFRFYYHGDGTEYLFEGEETTLLTVDSCRKVCLLDYDEDGIVELFVLTRYDEEPYMRYDMENGQITSCFVDEVPPEILEWFQMP